MSETAKTARNAMKEKAKRLTSADPHTKVDSSTWTPPEAENAGVKTGARPLSKRQFKKGGKVVGKHEGGEAIKRPDRKPRKAGGRATSLTPDTLINRDVRMANDVREGTKHVGAFKKGGKTHKADGGATEAQRVGAASSKFYKEGNKPAVQSTKSSDFDAMRNADRNLTTALEQQGYKKGGRIKHASGGEAGRGLYVRQGYPHEVPGVDGGRVARKHGGSAKGKTNVNIMIHPHSAAQQPPAMPMPMPVPPPRPPMAPPMPPQGMPMGAPMGGAPALPPMGAGRPGMPPIGRKNGGKIPAGMKTMHVIDNAAGGGLGRLEKIKEYGLK